MYKKITYLIAAFMVIMCFIFAYFLLATDLIADKLYGFKRTAFIVILLLYGSYRAYRIYIEVQRDKRNNS